jgi:hypothetical protein
MARVHKDDLQFAKLQPRRLLLAGVVDLRLEQELLGLLEEQRLGRLVAEAIGLALVDGVDRAIGLDVLAEREPHHAFAAVLAFGGAGDVRAEAQRRCKNDDA